MRFAHGITFCFRVHMAVGRCHNNPFLTIATRAPLTLSSNANPLDTSGLRLDAQWACHFDGASSD
jgi:hypothetical protein